MNVDNLSLILLPVITPAYLTESKLYALWHFATRLMQAMLDQNLLDKQFILDALVDMLEKNATAAAAACGNISTNNNKTLTMSASLKLIMNTVMHNMCHFMQSELLSRRLAHFCCKRLAALFNEHSTSVLFEPALRRLLDHHQQNSADTNSDVENTNKGANTSHETTPDTKSGQLDKLKPFVVNTTTTTPSKDHALPNNNNQLVQYVLRKDVSVDSVRNQLENWYLFFWQTNKNLN